MLDQLLLVQLAQRILETVWSSLVSVSEWPIIV